ncbi:MAG: hypothetical protein SGBAC_012551 [Bacillariaceae sp.]
MAVLSQNGKQEGNNKCIRSFKRMIIGIQQSGFNYSIDEAVDLFTADLQKKMNDEQADIFQVASILRCHRYHENDEDVDPTYRSYILWRCLLCAFLQLIVTPLVAASLVVDTFILRKDVDGVEQEAGEFCSMDSILLDDIVGKLVAFSFSVYIWFLYVKEQENNNAASDPANFLILQKNVIPTTVDGLLYIWGYCVNISSQFVSAISASAIIMATGSSIDIMLNSLAIFFINGLDDILATKAEYELAAELMAKGCVRGEEMTRLADGDQSTDDVKYREVRASFKPFKWNGVFSSFVTLVIISCEPVLNLGQVGHWTNFENEEVATAPDNHGEDRMVAIMETNDTIEATRRGLLLIYTS